MRNPPVRLNSTRVAWGHPQAILPAPSDVNPPIDHSLAQRRGSVTQDALCAPSSGIVKPSSGDLRIRDSSHYARVLEFTAIVGVVSLKILDEPTGSRNMFAMRNLSGVANLFIAFGREASASSTFTLAPGGILLLDAVVPQDDVYLISDTANTQFSCSHSTIFN